MSVAITLSYQPPTAGDHQVGIAGDFTNWLIIPLKHNKGIYTKTFHISAGSYQYKLIADGIWMPDPANPDTMSDPYGGSNSVLEVTDPAASLPDDDTIYTSPTPSDRPADFEVPGWVSEGIIYQIFPDRFCNGNPANDPDFHEWYYDHSQTPPPAGKYLKPHQEYFHLITNWSDISGLRQSPYLPKGKPDWWCFYGGDIAGVRQKLDYLSDLGINIIYFNPLCQAKSNHKYDAADFMTIDPHFGTAKEFRSFVTLCHGQGIRVIVDIAFNHTGETFWAFRDCLEKGPQSEYWYWYDWLKWPVPHPLPPNFKPRQYYQCWWGIKDMPDLNYDLSRSAEEENSVTDIKQAIPNQPLLDYLFACVKWWLLEMDIDGFRLDVPNEVPFWFWKLFRQKVKFLKPESWLVGEIWQNPFIWVSDEYFDSVMNYANFKDPVLDYFVKRSIDKQAFLTRLHQALHCYPPSAVKAMMNLLGSHDTWRLWELARQHPERAWLAVLFQMTYIGTPHIYYGDEIGMPGKKDPDNRRPFDWHWEQEPAARQIRQFYQDLIRFRKTHPVLQTGDLRFIQHPALVIFERFDQSGTIRVVINNEKRTMSYQTSPADVSVLYAWNSNIDILKERLSLPPYSALIIECNKSACKELP